jgi:hypothetical protein
VYSSKSGRIDEGKMKRLSKPIRWGLSYPEADIGTLDRPSTIDDMTVQAVRTSSNSYISKDDV